MNWEAMGARTLAVGEGDIARTTTRNGIRGAEKKYMMPVSRKGAESVPFLLVITADRLEAAPSPLDTSGLRQSTTRSESRAVSTHSHWAILL